MKVFTIGRDEACDLILDDPMISRRQAVIRLYPSGKIEIIDYSRNGTMVNGVRLAPETLTRVSRKDAISFAGTKTLDWKDVPDPSKPIKIAAGSVIGIVLLIFVIWGVKGLIAAFSTPEAVVEQTPLPSPAPRDTTSVKPQEQPDEKADGDKTSGKNPFAAPAPAPAPKSDAKPSGKAPVKKPEVRKPETKKPNGGSTQAKPKQETTPKPNSGTNESKPKKDNTQTPQKKEKEKTF